MPPNGVLQSHVRGARTKTIVRADSLLQGVLSPLPKDESDTTPSPTYPPVLQQHLNNIRKFSDCVVLTRIGNFYEMYFDQAEEIGPLVNLKVARRRTNLGPIPMAGFQYTQLDRYLKLFVQDLGKQVAISEEIRTIGDHVRPSGQLFDRKVTRVVTAGTLIDENFMDPYENNFLLSIHAEDTIAAAPVDSKKRTVYESYLRATKIGLSWVDLSSGDFFTQQSDLASLPSLVARIGPTEILLDSSMERMGQSQLEKALGEGGHSLSYHTPSNSNLPVAEWSAMLEQPIAEAEHSSFSQHEVIAGNLVLDYVKTRLMDMNVKLRAPARQTDNDYMTIDKQSLRGLEIRSTLRDGLHQGSLLHAVRQTVTKSGARLLSKRLVCPSMSLSVINNRLDLVAEMLNHEEIRESVVALLRRTFDTLRLVQKFSIGKGEAEDLLGLAKTIEIMEHVSSLLHDHIIEHQERPFAKPNDTPTARAQAPELTFMWDILSRMELEGATKLAKRIQNAIDEEGLSRQQLAEEMDSADAAEMASEVISADAAGEKAPKLTRRASKAKSAASDAESGPVDIWTMRRHASPTLERAHRELDSLVFARSELTATLSKKLGAKSLTLKWSAQLCHFCHVKGRDAQTSLSALEGARSIGSTKSTRSFYLGDWTHLGVRIDDAKLRIRTEEQRVFSMLRVHVLENLVKLRRNAAVLDELDVACSSATIAKERDLIRPTLNNGMTHNIIGGRHPMVDIGLKEQGRLFTSNDCSVGGKELIYLITGPNMAGKSTYLRQNALITILAQTGCFVPADFADIGLVDKIFSRVGSADNLYQDQSTFMVEMLETAEILKQATPRSYVIMDEVGRGTTPEDGIAVGYACIHHLHHVNKCRALFATHFHALADMTRDFERLACYCTDVAEENDGSWAYVHKLRRGVNKESHALKVARLAGV